MSPCALARSAPWLSPCCADCARSRQAGAADAPSSPAPPSDPGMISTGTGALLFLGGMAVMVLMAPAFVGPKGERLFK